MNQHAEAWVSRNKNRLKAYGSKVYLNNNDNFEIELYNPYTTNVLVKIWLNEELISDGGLVLRPGQRFFLDRFLEKNQKFQFSTYQVENSESSKKAIQNNGKVKVSFYKERPKTQPCFQPYVQPCTYPFDGITWINGGTGNPLNQPWSTHNILYGNTSNSVSLGSSNDLLCDNVSTTFTTTSMNSNNLSAEVTKSIETGRIEGGGESSQKFDEVHMDFNTIAVKTINWNILPASQKPVQAADIRQYCHNCGTRIRKQSWKFCPSCGESLTD